MKNSLIAIDWFESVGPSHFTVRRGAQTVSLSLSLSYSICRFQLCVDPVHLAWSNLRIRSVE